jgi:hypothetical protein
MVSGNFPRKLAGILLALLMVGVGLLMYATLTEPAGAPAIVTEDEAVFLQTLAWKFEDDDTLNLDGQPKTKVLLEAAYSDGRAETIIVDIVDGGCNELPSPGDGNVPGVPDVQCYYAGLGYRYAVTLHEGAYTVARQEFEEASPDYAPEEQQYEVIATFPRAR